MIDLQNRIKSATLINHIINPKECTHADPKFKAEDIASLLEIFNNLDNNDKYEIFQHLLLVTLR